MEILEKCANENGPRQANLVLIAYASSEGSGEPAHPRSLARTFAARSYKQWVKRNLQTESQIPGSSEWLGMRSWNLSWRNARRHKFAWRGPNDGLQVSNGRFWAKHWVGQTCWICEFSLYYTQPHIWIEQRHEKTCFCHMQTTKAQIRRAVWSALLLLAALVV